MTFGVSRQDYTIIWSPPHIQCGLVPGNAIVLLHVAAEGSYGLAAPANFVRSLGLSQSAMNPPSTSCHRQAPRATVHICHLQGPRYRSHPSRTRHRSGRVGTSCRWLLRRPPRHPRIAPRLDSHLRDYSPLSG